MTRWLVILSSPPLQIHDAAAAEFIDPTQRALPLLAGVSSLRSSVNGEVPGVTITLQNESAQAVPALRIPPLGAEAVLYVRRAGVTEEQFRGVVSRVQLQAVASIEVSA